MIKVSGVSKTYRGFDIERKDSGIGLWIKNALRLTANQAASVQALCNVSFRVERGEILGIFGLSGAVLRARCDAALARFGMVQDRDKPISQLSAGMRQKITLARGFLLDRPILYLDEPTVSLDVPSSAALRDSVTEYASCGGKTVLIASHNPVDLSICDRIMLLYRGEAIALGTMDELLAPLQGMTTLHINCAPPELLLLEQIRPALLQVGGIRQVWMAQADGRKQTWQVRLTLQQSARSTGEVVDCFIASRVPILGLQSKSLTLQDIYEYHVHQMVPSEADNARKA